MFFCYRNNSNSVKLQCVHSESCLGVNMWSEQGPCKLVHIEGLLKCSTMTINMHCNHEKWKRIVTLPLCWSLSGVMWHSENFSSFCIEIINTVLKEEKDTKCLFRNYELSLYYGLDILQWVLNFSWVCTAEMLPPRSKLFPTQNRGIDFTQHYISASFYIKFN